MNYMVDINALDKNSTISDLEPRYYKKEKFIATDSSHEAITFSSITQFLILSAA
jgi:hypothetical protein